MRLTLKAFKESENRNSTTKFKYLTLFEKFIDFIIYDCDSPEYNEQWTVEERKKTEIKYNDVMREINSIKELLSKSRGKEQKKRQERSWWKRSENLLKN